MWQTLVMLTKGRLKLEKGFVLLPLSLLLLCPLEFLSSIRWCLFNKWVFSPSSHVFLLLIYKRMVTHTHTNPYFSSFRKQKRRKDGHKKNIYNWNIILQQLLQAANV